MTPPKTRVRPLQSAPVLELGAEPCDETDHENGRKAAQRAAHHGIFRRDAVADLVAKCPGPPTAVVLLGPIEQRLNGSEGNHAPTTDLETP